MDIYPYKMVPYKGLSKDKSVDELLKKSDFTIARRIDLSEEDAGIHRVGGVALMGKDSRGARSLYNDIPELSTTILGVGASLKDCVYYQQKPGNNNWNGEQVCVKEYEGCVEAKNPCIQLVYVASNLHNQPVSYKKRFSKQSEAMAELKLMKESSVDMTVNRWFDQSKHYPLTGSIVLRREPTMLNFWHVVLVMHMINGKEVRRVDRDVLDHLDKEPKVNDSFALYVLDNFLLKNFAVNNIPMETNLQAPDFFDEDVAEEERNANANATKESFESVPIVI